jgi:hypothetical protein
VSAPAPRPTPRTPARLEPPAPGGPPPQCFRAGAGPTRCRRSGRGPTGPPPTHLKRNTRPAGPPSACPPRAAPG